MQPVRFLSKHFRSFALIFVVILLVLSSNKALAESKMEEVFLNKIRAAFKSHDEQEFWKLFNLEGVGEKVKASLDKHLVKKVVKANLISISLEPLPDDFRSEYVLNGVQYRPNVKPLGLVKMIYKKSKTGNPSTSMLYGQKGNDLMFAGTVGEKLQGDFPASKQIQVIVMGFSHPPVTFEGYMIYLQGGKPLRDKIKDMGGGNVTLIVRGEAITYLEVRRTSPKGEMKVKILEDENVIFETEQLKGDKPIIFQRPDTQ
jgi:hypothetical protein